MQLCAPKLRPLSMHGRRESARTEHVWTERERARSREFSATAVSWSDSRGRERGRMNREECAGGEVGGRAREWGGVLQVVAHSFRLAAYTSNPNHDHSVPYA